MMNTKYKLTRSPYPDEKLWSLGWNVSLVARLPFGFIILKYQIFP